MSKIANIRYTVPVKNMDGETVLEFTPEQMSRLNLKCGDTIEWKVEDDKVIGFKTYPTGIIKPNETD